MDSSDENDSIFNQPAGLNLKLNDNYKNLAINEVTSDEESEDNEMQIDSTAKGGGILASIEDPDGVTKVLEKAKRRELTR